MSTKLKIHDESRIHSTLKTTNTNANENNSKRSVNNSWHSNMAKIVNSPNTTTDGTLKKEKQTASTATTVVSKQPSDRLASSISSTLLNIPSPPCTNNPTLKFSSHFDDFLNPYTQKSIQFEQYRLDDRSHMIFQFIALSFFIGLILLLMFYVLLRYPYTELTDGINAFFYITIGILFMLLIVKFVLHHQNSSNHDKMTKQLTEDPKFHDLSHSQDLLKANTLSAIWKYFGKLWSSADEQERILEYISYYLITASIQLYVMYQLVLKHHYHYKLDYLPGRGSLPEGMVAVGLFCTLCVYFVFKNVSFRLAVILETSVFLMDLVVLCHWQLLASLSRLLLGYIVAMFILSEYHRQVWRSYEAQKQLEAIMQENIQLAEEIKSNELRHMIGNVAHDLKTPLSSFISGMEVIRKVAQALIQEQETPIAGISGRTEKLSTILEVAENVMNTNAFMIMTINRCIDYNKTLFGLKLTPKTESFRLKDSVEFTMSCLKNNFDAITINCEYQNNTENILKDGEIFITSDKQWMQENLLCLVGNAAKYSKKGSVVDVAIEIVNDVADEKSFVSSIPSPMSNGVPNSNGYSDLEANTVEVSPGRYQYSDNNSQPPSARCDGGKENSHQQFLKFTIADRGPGINDATISDKLFQEPAQAARLTGGTGLGLYSLARRVDTIGGRYGIAKRSDGESGCVIWFTVPFIVGACPSLVPSNKKMLVPHSISPLSKVVAIETNQGSHLATRTCGSSGPTALDQHNVDERSNQCMTMKETVCDIHQAPLNSCRVVDIEPNNSSATSLLMPSSNFNRNMPFPSIMLSSPKGAMLLESNSKSEVNILVVDDSPIIVKMTSLSLSKHGYEVKVASNGEEAVELYREVSRNCMPNSSCAENKLPHDQKSSNECDNTARRPFDVILMDFQMPVMDGLTAINLIRQEESISTSGKRCVIVGFSAKSDETQIDQGFKYGMDAFLPKPFTINAFENILLSIGARPVDH